MLFHLSERARHWLLADTPALSVAERHRATLGALLGISLCGFLLHRFPVGSHWLMAPLGATAVIVFALSHSPLAQPWPVIGSYAIATAAGLGAAHFIGEPVIAAAAGVAAAIWLMARLNCIHPPGGALVLLIVLGEPEAPLTTAGFVAFNVLAMLGAALLINNLVLGRRYPFTVAPHSADRHGTRDAPPAARTDLTHEDLEAAMRTLDTFVDVREDELVEIYNLAVNHAFGRHLGLTCGDIMSRDLVKVEYATELGEAWRLLREHHVQALPVVDRFDRLIGLLRVADYLRQLEEAPAGGLADRLLALLRRTPGDYSDKAETVGEIMVTNVHTVAVDTPVADLVPRLAEDLHHIPVLDATRRVVGMITQSDIIAALHRRVALAPPLPG